MVNTLSPERSFREISNYIFLLSLIGLSGIIFILLYQFALPRPQFVSLGSVSQFEIAQPVYLALTHEDQISFLWVVNLGDDIRVLDARATHPLSRNNHCLIQWITESKPWSRDKYYFADPCVGGAWDMDGRYQWGPSPRAMDFYFVELRHGELWIDRMYPQKGESWIK